jgi:hypothetical protein
MIINDFVFNFYNSIDSKNILYNPNSVEICLDIAKNYSNINSYVLPKLLSHMKFFIFVNSRLDGNRATSQTELITSGLIQFVTNFVDQLVTTNARRNIIISADMLTRNIDMPRVILSINIFTITIKGSTKISNSILIKGPMYNYVNSSVEIIECGCELGGNKYRFGIILFDSSNMSVSDAGDEPTQTDFTINNMPILNATYFAKLVDKLKKTRMNIRMPIIKKSKFINVSEIANKMGILDETNVPIYVTTSVRIKCTNKKNSTKSNYKNIDSEFIYYVRNKKDKSIVILANYY